MTLATTNRSRQPARKCHGVDIRLERRSMALMGSLKSENFQKSDRQEEGGRKEEKFETSGKGKCP